MSTRVGFLISFRSGYFCDSDLTLKSDLVIANFQHQNPVLSNTPRKDVGFLIPMLKMCRGVERMSAVPSHRWFPDQGVAPYNQTFVVGKKSLLLGRTVSKTLWLGNKRDFGPFSLCQAREGWAQAAVPRTRFSSCVLKFHSTQKHPQYRNSSSILFFSVTNSLYNVSPPLSSIFSICGSREYDSRWSPQSFTGLLRCKFISLSSLIGMLHKI